MNIGQFIFIGVCLILVSAGASVCAWKSMIDGSPFYATTLAENLVVRTDWIEISTNNSIKVAGDSQFVSIELAPPFKGDFQAKGIRNEEGELFNLEIKLVDEKGEELPLMYDGFLGAMNINYSYGRERLPTDRSFAKLLIKSDTPVTVKKISWVYYYGKDLK